MEMTRERFDALVGELEAKAEADFSAYKLRLLGLALLGYVYIFFILALIFALIMTLIVLAFFGKAGVVGVALKFSLPLLLLAGVVVRALWVRIAPPEGKEIRREQAPRLFAMIDEVGQAVDGPTVHRVQVDDEFNASILQIPRFGILGWQRNYLTLGVPLLSALSPDEFRAVLAHEMGHLSGAHGRFSAWIYRIRATWIQLLTALEQKQQTGSFVFRRFFEWYAPYFQAYSFVLARRHEYEADQTAVEFVGAGTTAATLTKVELYGSLLSEKFWPAQVEKAKAHDAPPDAFLEMPNALKTRLAPDLAERWLRQSLSARTGAADTHPALADRLRAIGAEPQIPEPAPVTAAEEFFGETLPGLIETLNEEWKQHVAEGWRERHKAMREKGARLDALDAQAETGEMSNEERWERGSLTEELRGMESALPLYRTILDSNPGDAGAHFTVGRGLLELGDEAGIERVQCAMKLDVRSMLPGCEQIYGFLLLQGRIEEARVYFERGRTQADLVDQAQAERAQLNFSDRYGHHQASPEAIEKITAKLAEYDEVAAAYLIRKEVKIFPDFPLYVCGIDPKPQKGGRSDEANQALGDILARNLEFPGETFVVILGSGNQKMGRIMQEIDGSRIYP